MSASDLKGCCRKLARRFRPEAGDRTARQGLRRSACGGAVLAVVLAAPVWAEASRQHTTEGVQAFVNAVLIDGTGTPAIDHATVIVRGTKIESAGPATSVKTPRGATVTDLHGKTLMPGLADMHVHLVGGWDGHAVDMLGYRRYLNALLYAGVTTVLDTGNVQPYIVQMRDEIAAGRLPGPRIYCVGALVDGADPVWPPLSYAVGSVGQVEPVVKALKRDNVDFIKAYVGLSHPVLERLVEEGHKVSLRVIIDQWRRNGSPDLIDDGIYGFAHMPTRLLSPHDVQYMQAHKTVFISTLVVFESQSRRRLANLDFLKDRLIQDTSPPSFIAGLRAEAARKLSAEQAQAAQRGADGFHNAMANASALFHSGILIAAGTDAAYPGDIHGEGLHRELELLVESGLTPVEAIMVATQNAAKFVGATDWGTIEPGKLANLIVVDGRPDHNISDTRKVTAVMIRGRSLDLEGLKLVHQNDPGYEPVSPTDY